MSAIPSMFAIVANLAGAELVLYQTTQGGPMPMIAEQLRDLAVFYPTADAIRRKCGMPWYIARFNRDGNVAREPLASSTKSSGGKPHGQESSCQ